MASKLKPTDVLREMEEDVGSARSGHLELGHRLRLWSAMSSKYGNEEAWLRRAALGLLVAAQAALRWNPELVAPDCPYQNVLDGFPQRCLDVGRRFALDEASLEKFEEAFDPVEDLIDHVGFCVNDELVAVFGMIASLKPCLLQTEDELFIDRYKELVAGVAPRDVQDMAFEGHRDVHFHGSWFAGHFDRQHRSQSARRRHYWLHWIRDLAPIALGSLKKVTTLLSDEGAVARRSRE